MTQEEKDLLLKDLCARLPYEVKVKFYDHWVDEYEIIPLTTKLLSDTVYIGDIKPYLFPLSSMNKKQRKEYESLCIKETSECTDLYGIIFTKDYYYDTVESFDYLYKNHIDIRGLIPMGLAIDATELNVY